MRGHSSWGGYRGEREREEVGRLKEDSLRLRASWLWFTQYGVSRLDEAGRAALEGADARVRRQHGSHEA